MLGSRKKILAEARNGEIDGETSFEELRMQAGFATQNRALQARNFGWGVHMKFEWGEWLLGGRGEVWGRDCG